MTSTLVQKLVCKLLNKYSCQSQNWKSRNFIPLYGSTENLAKYLRAFGQRFFAVMRANREFTIYDAASSTTKSEFQVRNAR